LILLIESCILDKDGDMLSDRGVLDHYGTFYGLAVALCMEGFMSGAYHVCPNRENFAFGKIIACIN